MQAPCPTNGRVAARASSSWPIGSAASRPPPPLLRAFAAAATSRRRAANGASSPPRAAAAARAANGGARWAFSAEPQRVRDYELDVFQVVNNGVYASLFQDARHLALERLTGTSVTAFLQSGVLMALSELVIRYKAPLRSGDWYVSRVGVAEVRGTRVTLSQQVVRVREEGGGGGGWVEAEIAAEGEATVVFLDPNYRPARMPADAKRAFERWLLEADAASG